MTELKTTNAPARPSGLSAGDTKQSKRRNWIAGGVVLLVVISFISVISLVSIQRWKRTPKIKMTLQTSAKSIWSVAFSPDGQTVAVGGDGLVQLWNARTGELRLTLKYEDSYGGSGRSIRSLAFSPDGKTLAATVRTVVVLWDVQTGTARLKLMNGGDNSLTPVAFSPDGQTLATGSPLRLWDAQTGELKRELTTYFTGVETIAFSPDGGSLAATVEAKDEPLYFINVWDTQTLELKLRLPVGTYPTKPLAYSPDGKMLASSDFHEGAKIWDAHTGELKRTLELTPGRDIESLAFSPNGKLFALGFSYGEVWLYDARTWSILHKLPKHTTRYVAFSPDSEVLAATRFSSLELWDVSGLK